MPPVLVDARGMRCPWPALRLAKAMRGPDAGEGVRLLADDPVAGHEVAALASAQGWSVFEDEAGGWRVFSQKQP